MMNRFNPHETGHLHGMLPIHLGMHVRLLETLDKARGLVGEAEGVVVHVVAGAADQARIDAAAASTAQEPVYLEHVPLGIWLRGINMLPRLSATSWKARVRSWCRL